MTAQAVLHRELFHIHSSLQLILTILRGPWELAPLWLQSIHVPTSLPQSCDAIPPTTSPGQTTPPLFQALQRTGVPAPPQPSPPMMPPLTSLNTNHLSDSQHGHSAPAAKSTNTSRMGSLGRLLPPQL